MTKKVNEILKSHRQQKRFSLESVHRETRISLAYLEAFESAQWQVFPAEVYLLGFLRKYSTYLGLDPDEMVQLYKDELQMVRVKEEEETRKETVIRQQEESRSFFKGVVLIILVALFGGWWLYTVIFSSKVENKAFDTENLRKKLGRSTLFQRKSLSLDVQSLDDVWIRVVADKKLSFEGFVSSGTTRSWDADNEILVRIGNVRSVELTLNGQPIDARAGAQGGINELLLTPRSVHEPS